MVMICGLGTVASLSLAMMMFSEVGFTWDEITAGSEVQTPCTKATEVTMAVNNFPSMSFFLKSSTFFSVVYF